MVTCTWYVGRKWDGERNLLPVCKILDYLTELCTRSGFLVGAKHAGPSWNALNPSRRVYFAARDDAGFQSRTRRVQLFHGPQGVQRRLVVR